MTFKNLLITAALAGAAQLPVAAATDPVDLIPTGPGVLSALVVREVNDLFIDTFSFTPDTFNGRVSVSLFGISGPISFFTASLNGQDFSYFPETGATTFAFQADVTDATPLTLTVFGAVLDADGNFGGAGSYSAAISAAVPEPLSYAMLVAGLGVLALTVRRKSRSV